MPDQHITFTDAEMDVLEKVRLQEGLDHIEQAAEWLAKTRLRRQAKQTTGRGRALYLAEKEGRG